MPGINDGCNPALSFFFKALASLGRRVSPFINERPNPSLWRRPESILTIDTGLRQYDGKNEVISVVLPAL
ncbi:MAG: hypothetical protein HWE34_09610 [Methylocystaceae bacterium]|nr:hypothetical protein [Methylocystaceae bacterium]